MNFIELQDFIINDINLRAMRFTNEHAVKPVTQWI